jgi:hypothetical protein
MASELSDGGLDLSLKKMHAPPRDGEYESVAGNEVVE